jgi:hypothetical protein
VCVKPEFTSPLRPKKTAYVPIEQAIFVFHRKLLERGTSYNKGEVVECSVWPHEMTISER